MYTDVNNSTSYALIIVPLHLLVHLHGTVLMESSCSSDRFQWVAKFTMNGNLVSTYVYSQIYCYNHSSGLTQKVAMSMNDL